MHEVDVLPRNTKNARMLSDAELIRQARGGNALAFRRIVERYESKVAPTIIGMLGAGDEADDVGQETFIRFYRTLPKLEDDTSLAQYLNRIAINLCLDTLKRRRRWRQRFTSWDAASLPEPLDTSEPPLDTLERSTLVYHALQQLKPRLRMVAVLRLIDGYSTRETAQMLAIPVGTVLSRLSRAQAKLKSLLEPYFDDHER